MWRDVFVDSFCLFHADVRVPLSPQWLLPKPGDSKPAVGTGVCSLNFFMVLYDLI